MGAHAIMLIHAVLEHHVVHAEGGRGAPFRTHLLQHISQQGHWCIDSAAQQ